ncbi:acetyltransferase (GNAT) family protein [mine drainage metagenome]|uniref:Acetyltransferase (GNAT) family protein n=1 Tax=mine drainage metagenome TaxID=410659 RepID=A0A1J5SGQ9_9ZZZZ
MIKIKRVTSDAELEGIKKLQSENLNTNISAEEAQQQGFLSAVYSVEFLKMMHNASPSVIAVDGDVVVGYALVSTKGIRHHHDLLADLFNAIDKINYQGISLKDANYVVVGQLCVAKNYRGQGLVQQMYEHFRDSLQNEFDYCLTDVAQANPRSLKAHLTTGFKIVNTLTYGGISWDVVMWDWTKNK